jgi:hypothetical protein
MAAATGSLLQMAAAVLVLQAAAGIFRAETALYCLALTQPPPSSSAG